MKCDTPINEYICVDGACNNPYSGTGEYKIVYMPTGKILYQSEKYEDTTNNLMEFLALTHALTLCKQQSLTIPVFTDSTTAMAWVKKKRANTSQEVTSKNKRLFKHLFVVEKWLSENKFSTQVLKWETKHWGEIPADFGRK